MSNLSLPYTFTSGTTAKANEVTSDFTTIRDYINNRNGGTSSWDNLKTLAALYVAATTNQIVLGDTAAFYTTLTSPAPSASRTYTIPDAGANASFVMTESAQTVNGVLTLANGYKLKATNTATITQSALAANRAYAIPDAGADASFVLTKGDATISGIRTFDGQLVGKGTATNDSAATGYIGEYVESVVSAVSFPSTGAYGDLTSISLTAGDWDVAATISSTPNGATVTTVIIGVSTTSGNSSTGLVFGSNAAYAALPNATNDAAGFIVAYRISLSATTTVYFKFRSSYSVATPKASGRLSARRVR